jgi:hypothetical protein
LEEVTMQALRPGLTRAMALAALTLLSGSLLACSRPTPQAGSTAPAPGPNIVEPTRDPKAPYPPVYPTIETPDSYPQPDSASEDDTSASATITATMELTGTAVSTP